MQKISLYIRGQRADLGSAADSLILWTYTFEDIASPAAVKNSYTKTVTLPGTAANHAIFSSIYRPDRRYYSGRFDPLARSPFVIMNERNEILERGYVKLESVSRTGTSVISYNIGLFGGLGAFLYELTYKASGDKKTLADMVWPRNSSDTGTADDPYTFTIGQEFLGDAWAALKNDTYDANEWGIVNFAPAFNGYPDDNFDANKAFYKPGSTDANKLGGVPTSYTDPDTGVVYGPNPNTGGVLIDLGNKVTEWEVQDIRDNLQRPCFSIKRFLQALKLQANTGDWTFTDYDQDTFGGNNPYIEQGWITLPYPGSYQAIGSLLATSRTPADYLIALCKMFGWVLIVDPSTRKVEVRSRNWFFSNGSNNEPATLNLGDRIDPSRGTEMHPYVMTARIYDFSLPTPGAFASSILERTGREYGSFRLDTAYGFDASVVDVMGSLPFRGAAMADEQSPWFFAMQSGTYGQNYIKFPRYGTVTYNLYGTRNSQQVTYKMTCDAGQYATQTYELPEWLPQFHDADGKPADADGVFLFFLGTKNFTQGTGQNPVRFHLSAYQVSQRTVMNGGKECWDISPGGDIAYLPIFSRWYDTQLPVTQVVCQADFGTPLELAGSTPPSLGADNLYYCFWDNYLADRFDRNTQQLTAWVDLRGLQVDQWLLSKFWYYQGAVWVLNKIIDYNPADPGLTKCELVKVNDKANYYAGQRIPYVN